MKYNSDQITQFVINALITLAIVALFSHSIESLYYGLKSGEYIATFGVTIRTLFLTTLGGLVLYKLLDLVWGNKK